MLRRGCLTGCEQALANPPPVNGARSRESNSTLPPERPCVRGAAGLHWGQFRWGLAAVAIPASTIFGLRLAANIRGGENALRFETTRRPVAYVLTRWSIARSRLGS